MASARGLHGFDGDRIMAVCVGEFWSALHGNEGRGGLFILCWPRVALT